MYITSDEISHVEEDLIMFDLLHTKTGINLEKFNNTIGFYPRYSLCYKLSKVKKTEL